MKKRTNEQGLSLVEVLIAAGLTMVVATGLAQILTNMAKGQKGVSERQSFQEIVNSINLVFNQNSRCQDALVLSSGSITEQMLRNSTSTNRISLQKLQIPFQNGTASTIIEAGAKVPGAPSLSVPTNGIALYQDTTSAANTTQLMNPDGTAATLEINEGGISKKYNVYIATLTVTINRPLITTPGANNSIGSPSFTKTFRMMAGFPEEAGGSGVLTLCNQDTSAAYVCQNFFNGTYHPNGLPQCHIPIAASEGNAGFKINTNASANSSGTTRIEVSSTGDIKIGSTAQLNVKSAGNVGIGATTPNSRLEVKGAGATLATSALNVTDSSGSSKFFVRNDGYVGINATAPKRTTAPTERITLVGDVLIDGNLYFNGTNRSISGVTNITANGDITANQNITAMNNMTAGNNLEATRGTVAARLGKVTAATTVEAGGYGTSGGPPITSSSVTCSATCPPGQVMLGVTISGGTCTPSCAPASFNCTCPTGQTLTGFSIVGGTCNPTCSGSAAAAIAVCINSCGGNWPTPLGGWIDTNDIGDYAYDTGCSGSLADRGPGAAMTYICGK